MLFTLADNQESNVPLGPAFEFASPSKSTSSSSSVSVSWSSSDSERSNSPSNDYDECCRDGRWKLETVHDPFSASTKGTRPPPLYFKKRELTPPNTPISSIETPRQKLSVADEPGTIKAATQIRELQFLTPPSTPSTVTNSTESDVWERAMSTAIDHVDGNIDLSNHGLTFIPTNINDLSKLVVLPSSSEEVVRSAVPRRGFSRISSAPASYSVPAKRTFGRYQTSAYARPSLSPASQKQDAEIQLYLAKNTIRRIPRELFALRGLTVLSLRNNSIEFLPPSIAALTSLRELNISYNKIRYLPSELDALHLNSFQLHPNPFLPPPVSSSNSGTSSRYLSPISRRYFPHGRVIPLSEMAYRVLLAPSPLPRLPNSNLTAELNATTLRLNWQLYDTDDWVRSGALPPNVLQVLVTATSLSTSPPDDQYRDWQDDNSSPRTLVEERLDSAAYYPHHCPSSNHDVASPLSFAGRARPSGLYPSSLQARPPLPSTPSPHKHTYLLPAEERYQWVDTIAGVRISETDNGRVPILWRGCSPGCLSFLSPEDEHDVDASGTDVDVDVDRLSEGNDGFDVDELSLREKENDAGSIHSLGGESEDSFDQEIGALS